MQYQNNGDSGGSGVDALKQNLQTSEDQKNITEETFDEFLLQVNEESKIDFENRIREFEHESAPKETNSSKFTSRSRLGFDDDILLPY